MNALNFDPDGTVRFIYDDDLAKLVRGSVGDTVNIKRASHVEPYQDGWIADMSPVGGGTYGPFATRKVALAFEVAWLKENRDL